MFKRRNDKATFIHPNSTHGDLPQIILYTLSPNLNSQIVRFSNNFVIKSKYLLVRFCVCVYVWMLYRC